MNLLLNFILILSGVLAFSEAGAQDPSIQVLTQNSGMVSVGQTVFLQVTVGNTLTTPVPANKIRVSISAPASVTLDNATTQLPAGFVICSNAGGTMVISNSSTAITQSAPQTILVAMIGTTVAPSSTVSGSMLAAGGTVATRCNNGGAIATNTTPNDNSTSTVQVTAATIPVTLTDFKTLLNCQPALNWVTETEINSDRFEIERANLNNSNWIKIGAVAANGNTSVKYEYDFIDKNLNTSSEKVLYRLKIIDKDGQYKYSEVLAVFSNCKTQQLVVYPNPAKTGKLFISITGLGGNTEASLLTITGQVILAKVVNNGTNYLNISSIANGVYVLNIKDENGLNKKVSVLIQK